MTARGTTDASALSAECALAGRPGYEDVHGACRQLRDVLPPHSPGLLLVRRCGCGCHRPARDVAARSASRPLGERDGRRVSGQP